MTGIKTYNAISPKGLAIFPESDYKIGADVEDPAAVILRSQDLHKEIISESVLAIGRAGAGVNNVPVDAMSTRGIVVFNAPGGNANAVTELVIGALIAASRNIVEATRFVESLASEGEALLKEVEGGKKKFSGSEIKAKTLGVIGLGAIGAEVANAACALGMEVIGHDPFATPEQLARLSSAARVVSDKNDVLGADAITVHVPLLPTTRNTIDADSLSRIKRGAILLNFSRDGIVDDTAALGALKNGTLAKYVTDFPTRELIGVPGVIATPHLGASTEDAEDNCAMMVARQVRDYLENGNVVNAVNLPKVSLAPNGKRLSIVHENVPDMLGKITHALGERGINIESAANGARGSLAYTLMNVGGNLPDDLLLALRSIAHVIRVRVL